LSKKTEETPKIKPIEIKPLKEIKEMDGRDQSGFVCDFETGVCGPADKMKEESK
jgi:hypothetical protein